MPSAQASQPSGVNKWEGVMVELAEGGAAAAVLGQAARPHGQRQPHLTAAHDFLRRPRSCGWALAVVG